MNHLKFKNGDEMAAIGLGTWKSKADIVEKAVEFALLNGYRHIDCAKTYANETGVGKAFSSVFNSGKVKREEVWITSKLWNNAHKKKDVIPALKSSLKDLRLDYLDLYLIHWPVAFKPEIHTFPQTDNEYLSLEEAPLIETWEAMLEAKKLGLIRHAGVSNFSIKKLDELSLLTDEMPEMNQFEIHPFLPQNELINYCHQRNIHVTAYSPLGSGDRHQSMKKNDEPSLIKHPLIIEIAKKHNCNPAQVLISWSEKRGTAVIPKSVSEEHILLNIKSSEIQLDEADMAAIQNIGMTYRFVDGEFFVTPGNSYQNIFDL